MIKILNRKSFLTFFLSALIIMVSILSADTSIYLVYMVLAFLSIWLFKETSRMLGFVMFTSTINGITFFGDRPLLEPENISVITGVLLIYLYAILKRQKIALSYELFAFIFFIGFAIITSLVNSPVLAISKNGIIQLTIAFLGLVLMQQTQFLKDKSFVSLIKGYAFIAVIHTLYGLISFVFYRSTNVNIGGIMLGQGADSVTLKGAFMEANLFGAFVGVGLCLTLMLLVDKTIVNKKFWYIAGILQFIGLVLSWTRSAWIGFAIGLVVLSFFAFRKFFTFKTLNVLILTSTFILLPIILLLQNSFDSASGQKGLFLSKITGLFETDKGTGLYRLNQFQLAQNDLKGNELFGKGYFSIKAYQEDEWISNLFLSIYHDTGIIGLCIFLSILISIMIKAIHSICLSEDNIYRSVQIALLAGFILYLVSFNFTPGHTLSMFWVHLGLMLAVSSKLNNIRKE